MSASFANPGTKVVAPFKLAHVVLKTQPSNYKQMVDFYKTFLSATASHENEYMSFLRYDDEHHRIAIIAMPDLGPKDPKASGLFHIAFTFESLTDLSLAYLQRKGHGIEPYWCVNHGPTTSMYYRDPDGNDLETQVDNMALDEANEFMMSPAFAENPIGFDFKPEDLIKRLEAGESDESIKKRPEIGQRGVPTFV